MATWSTPLPDAAVEGELTHIEDHDKIVAAINEVRANVDAVEASAGDVPIFSTLAAAQAWEAANPGRTALTTEPPAADPDAPFIVDTFSTPGQFFESVGGVDESRRTTETGEDWLYGDEAVFTSVGHGPYGEASAEGRAVATLGNYLSPTVAVPDPRVKVSFEYSIPAATHLRLAIAGYIVHIDPGGARFRLMTSSASGAAAVVETQATPPPLAGTVAASYDGYSITVESDGGQVVAWSVTERPSDLVGFSVPTGGWVDNFEVTHV